MKPFLSQRVTTQETESIPPFPGSRTVESRSGAVAVVNRSVSTPRSSNRTCGFPASGFRTKVISCFRPREVGCGSRQPHQPQRPVKVFVRITASAGTSDFMFPTQPLTQPMSAMSVHCAIDFAHRSKAKVIAPASKQRIEFFYLLGRFAAQCPALCLLANSLDNPGIFFVLGCVPIYSRRSWSSSIAQSGIPGSRRTPRALYTDGSSQC